MIRVCFGQASFVDRRINRRKDNVIMKLFVWLLQRVAEMLRNLVLIVSWPNLRPSWLGIFRIPVSAVSYKIFELFFCKKIPLSRRVEYVINGSVSQ